jgi:glycosyltransferase involved in cell wall biosynthesis
MIESVLRQTFDDYEIIIVNDGSTDNTTEILESISLERVRIIHTQNLGPSRARNTAIEQARADIIMNLDADDKIAPELFEKAYTIFCRNPNAGIVYSDAELFGAKSGKFQIGKYSPEAMLFENRITSLAFFRKEDWQSVRGYSEKFIYGLEDWDFWLSIIELGRDVVRIPENLVYYRTYKNLADSRSGRIKTERHNTMEAKVAIFHRHKNLYATFPKASEHFSKIETLFKDENFLVRRVKNQIYRHIQKYYWR